MWARSKTSYQEEKVDVDLTYPALVRKHEVQIAFHSGLVLYNKHYRNISDEEWLSDLHTNGAQALLKQQFSHVPGLQGLQL